MASDAKKIIKDMLPEKLLSCYSSFRYKQLLHQNQRENLTFGQAEEFISRRYLHTIRKVLNWGEPESYTEKMNIVKLYGGNQIKTKLADKLSVREWIKEKIGEEYLIPLIGTYACFDEIDFEKLPDCFVMKCNHDCGSVFLCKNKNNINNSFWKNLKKRYDFYCKRNFAYSSFEMQYKFIVPSIMIEELIGEKDTEVEDYKFLCFNGKPYYCLVVTDRFTNHKQNIYDLVWNLQPFQMTYANTLKPIARPAQFEEMKNIATKLCQGFDHVRVDLYSVCGKVFFGEMTFTTASGLVLFTPSEYDYELGKLWELDNDRIQIKRRLLQNIKLKDYKYEAIGECNRTDL